MSCAKTDTRQREDPAAGGDWFNPIAAILWQRPSSPNAGDKSGFEEKEAGSMVARQWQEGQSQERNTRKSTEKNGTAEKGQTADEKKNK